MKNARLAGIVRPYFFRRNPSYLLLADYYITWNKGIGASPLMDYRFGSVRRKVDRATLPAYDYLLGTKDYHGEYNNVEYLLTKGELNATFTDSFRQNHFKVVKTSGDWKLYRKEIPQ